LVAKLELVVLENRRTGTHDWFAISSPEIARLQRRRLDPVGGRTVSAGGRQPTAQDAGLTADTIPRDLRGSFASLLIFEGLNVLEVAAQLGHKPSTCLDIYGRLFEEFDPPAGAPPSR
jgi:integrase